MPFRELTDQLERAGGRYQRGTRVQAGPGSAPMTTRLRARRLPTLVSIAASLVLLLICSFVPRVALAQESGVIVPPNTETRSMGLPETWRPEVGAAFYWDRDDGEDIFGSELHASLYHALGNPMAGVGLAFEGFVRGAHGARPSGGVRLMIPIRYIGLQWGWEYDVRRETVQGVFSFTPPLRRGGLFGQGDRFRFDWSGSTFRAGLTFPLRGRWMGTSRPPSTRPSLPQAPRRSLTVPAAGLPADLQPADGPHDLADLRVAARWVPSDIRNGKRPEHGASKKGYVQECCTKRFRKIGI